MVFLAGQPGPANMWLPPMQALGWGRMFTEQIWEPYPGERYGFDNGAFTCWQQGRAWDESAYLRRLERVLARTAPPYLCVLPDRVAHPESLAFSLLWLERLPAALPWYLAVQDGMEPAQVEPHLCCLAGLFLGGSDAFKATAPAWCQLAHAHGRRFHYGRAGTPRKLLLAREIGADSADSTRPLRSRRDFQVFADLWRGTVPQLELFNGVSRVDGPRQRWGFETARPRRAPAAEQMRLEL